MFYDIIVIALAVLVDALFNILVKINHHYSPQKLQCV